MEQGLIHIYCGDGKGKTTAALGLAARCSGRGRKVLIVQFLKSQDTGELNTFDRIPEITVIRGKEGHRFSFDMTDEEKAHCMKIHNDNLLRAIHMCRAEKIDLLILDEVIAAYNKDLVDKSMLLDFLRSKPSKLEIAMTGRNPDEPLIELADYVSEIKKIKHPFDKGIPARDGIER